jgi:anionic cell wall polymer biosynthesis LytR-Cps2A-Psr (LCP) family protein
MYYNDPTQDLYINLSAGEQKLDGEQAMGLVRYRSGYATADIQRMSVQRDFIQACMDQWFTVKNLWRTPALLKIAGANSTTDLSPGNMLWVALACKRCSFGETTAEALAGSAAWWNGGSYYGIDPYGAVEQLNTYCNPYKRDITVDDLYVRVP